MAKDVDLSSKEWRDLVFEGKNKEFGAYTLRADSTKRHTFAIVVVLGVLVVILTFLILWLTGVFKMADEETNVKVEQQTVETASEEEEQKPEEEFVEYEEPEPEEQKEETTATQAVTEVSIVDEVDKAKEVKTIDMEDTRQVGAEDVQGTEDLNKAVVIDEVVEAPKVEEKPKVQHEQIVDMAMVEQKPSFKGGDAALYKWLNSQIVYPAAASEEGVQGKVIVAFVVEKDGRVTNVQVVRKKHPALDAEALRVVKKMPNWTPGRNNGQPVRVKYNLPVTFKLQQ